LFAIWVLNVMGGGDVKLWAAAVLLIPPHVLPELNFFMQVFIFGGILGIIYLILWPMMPKGWTPQPKAFWRRILRVEIRRISRKGPLPYAVAISASAIIALSQVIR
jgi:prepilin peptidase CpaA